MRFTNQGLARRARSSSNLAWSPVSVIANPSDVASGRQACAENVEIVALEIDDAWFRDSGPNYVVENNELVATCWQFNGWGEKFVPYDKDATIASRWAKRAGHKSQMIDMVLEGGSINVDGAGTLITTEQCLLNPNRNPHLSREQIENRLCNELGQQQVVWLPFGLALDDDTDGHVDNVAAFTSPGHVLLQGCNDAAEEDYARMFINEKVARSSLSGRGEQLEIDVVPVLPFVETSSGRVVVPYLNFYVGNNFVVIPVTGHEADNDMVQMIGEYFPGRDMVPLEIGRILAVGGGGIHCITQQVPA